MIALDTNVVLRLLLDDSRAQAVRARALAASAPVSIPISVILETEWALRSVYGIKRPQMLTCLRAVSRTGVRPAAETAVLDRAIAWFENGMDFADALHLASSAKATNFATFDVQMIRIARSLQTTPPVSPP
jgi:predicted nucleic-acid-binding protein